MNFLSSVCIFMALRGTLSTSLFLIKSRETPSSRVFTLLETQRHRVVTDWGCRILCAPTRQEILHLYWVIERSEWFHFRKSRSHLGGKMDIPCYLVLSHISLLVLFSVLSWDGKTLLLNEPPENISPANTGAALSRFCAHMTNCICQYVQWKQSRFHCSYNDILIDWCYLLAGFHSFSFISIDFSTTPPTNSPCSHGVKSQRGKHCLISVNDAAVHGW